MPCKHCYATRTGSRGRSFSTKEIAKIICTCSSKARLCLRWKCLPAGEVPIYTAEALDIIGWSSMTPIVRQRTASVRATKPSLLLGLNSKLLQQMCEEDHELGLYHHAAPGKRGCQPPADHPPVPVRYDRQYRIARTPTSPGKTHLNSWLGFAGEAPGIPCPALTVL